MAGKPGSGFLDRMRSWLAGAAPEEAVPSASGPTQGAGAEAGGSDAEQASRKRLGFIMRFAKEPGSDPRFADKALVYRVISEERVYQQGEVVRLTRALRALGPAAEPGAAEDPRRSELQAKLDVAKRYQSHLFGMMKAVMGKAGKTGGTGMLAPPVDTSLPVEELLGEAFNRL